jgi:very-short-patch-repair endonuclease
MNEITGHYFPFDYLLEILKIIIELDGNQHFIQIPNRKDPLDQQERDIYKMKCANANGYSMIRIVQVDVYYNRYDWQTELNNAIMKIILDNRVQNIYLCKNDEYRSYPIV